MSEEMSSTQRVLWQSTWRCIKLIFLMYTHQFWGNISKTGFWSLPTVTHWRRRKVQLESPCSWTLVEDCKSPVLLRVLLESLCSKDDTDRAPEEVALHQGGVGHVRGGEAPEAERRECQVGCNAKPIGNVNKEIHKYPWTSTFDVKPDLQLGVTFSLSLHIILATTMVT